MIHQPTWYSREDILQYKSTSNSINGLQIENHLLFHSLSRDTNRGLSKLRTKRGTRAGKRTHHRKFPKTSIQRTIPDTNLLPTVAPKAPRQNDLLPSILYTNCRSLNTWKLAELNSYIEIHKPAIVCLTETWLDQDKQQLVNIEGYNNHFANRKNRIGGGVEYVFYRHHISMLLSLHVILHVPSQQYGSKYTSNNINLSLCAVSTILQMKTKAQLLII